MSANSREGRFRPALGSRRPYGAARILMMRIPRTASAAADLSWANFLSSLREDCQDGHPAEQVRTRVMRILVMN